MTVLARSLSHIAFSAASARDLSLSASSMSKTLPWRTPLTPAKPSEASAPSIALPCGSRTPDLRVTVTRAFIKAALLDQHRSRALRPLLLDEDAEPPGDLLVRLEQP